MNQTNNQIIEPTARAETRPIFKFKIFGMLLLLFSMFIVGMSYSEISRWRQLSESYINRKGLTLVKTVEPHALNFIESENNKGLQKLTHSLTSTEIPENDVISVQILDSSMHKLAESSPKMTASAGNFITLPAAVVVANPIYDPDSGRQVGVLRMVFSNRLFEIRSRQVLDTSLYYFFLALIFSGILTWYLSSIFEKPVQMPAEAARKISRRQLETLVEIGSNKET